MGSADPSQSGVDKHKGTAAGGRPGPAPSRGGGVRASEGTNPCTRPSFATKNVFDVLQDRKPVRLKVANGQYMVGGTKEAAIGLQFVNHRELSRPDLGKEILLHGSFYEAEMDWDMIVGYDFMMETDSGVLPAQASMTLYQDDQLSWLSSPEHHVECQWIHPERNQLEVAALDTEPTGSANQEYGVRPEVASRVVADLGASDLGPGCVLFRNLRPSSGL